MINRIFYIVFIFILFPSIIDASEILDEHSILITQILTVILVSFIFLLYRHKELSTINKKLENQKELYSLVFENSSNGVLIIDAQSGKFTDCNDQIVKILKYNSKKDILDIHPSYLSPEFQPDGRKSDEKAHEMITLALKNGSHAFEWKHTRATGEDFWAEIILTSIILDNQKMIHVVWKDIDEKKQSRLELEHLNNTLEMRIQEATMNLEQKNNKLQESVDNFQDLLDTTMEMIMLIDDDKIIININQSGINMLGYEKKSDVIGKHIKELILPSELPKVLEHMKKEVTEPYELIMLKNDGTEMPTLNSAKNIIRNGIKIRLAMLMDLTNIKQNEKLLQQQSRLAQMGEMISMIAHQWRQPLGAVSSAVMGIQTKLASGRYDFKKETDRDEFFVFMNQKLKNINGYVQVLSTTINDFRNFFKPDKVKEIVAITIPIEKALQIVQTSMSAKGIKIKTNYDINHKLNLYPNEMMQVILNILKNSEDNFLEKKISNPQINIATRKEQSDYIISIWDNGGGIPKDILPKIFDPYFSTKSEKNGTGLGLYMSKIMVEEHNNGTVRAKNIDDGICFEIIIKGNANV
jgi:PAS domain S-box-containing protein